MPQDVHVPSFGVSAKGTSTHTTATLTGEGFVYDNLPDEIGPSQPLDTPLTQPSQPQGRRRHRSPDCYTLGTAALDKAKSRGVDISSLTSIAFG